MCNTLGKLRYLCYALLKYMYRIHQSALHTKQLCIVGLASMFLTACADSSTIQTRAERSATSVFNAATGPLTDLNIRRTEIPELLKKLVNNPYARPKLMQCSVIKEELAQIDALIGPDLYSGVIEPQYVADTSPPDEITLPEMPEMPDTETLVSNGEAMLGDRILAFIRTQTDIMPFRNVIRFISGADRHEELVKKATQAGYLRRAYLTGLAHEHFGTRCLMPPVILEARAKPQ